MRYRPQTSQPALCRSSFPPGVGKDRGRPDSRVGNVRVQSAPEEREAQAPTHGEFQINNQQSINKPPTKNEKHLAILVSQHQSV